MTDPTLTSPVDDLVRRAARLEGELRSLELALAAMAPGLPRPGAHLEVAAGPHHALVPADTVVQIVRLVAFDPIPRAGPAVLGTFLRRGQPGVAVDLCALLGVVREPELDAHMVITGGVRLLGLVVARVCQVVESPVRTDRRLDAMLPAIGQELLAGWFQVQGRVVPLLLLEGVERAAGLTAPNIAPPGEPT
jgi:purine-binding chemotaxis protein CheW